LEAEAFLIGHWKNFEELERNISLPELEVIVDAAREKEFNRNKFMAALKGIDLDANAAGSAQDRFEEAKARAYAKAAGKSEEEAVLGELGWGIEEED